MKYWKAAPLLFGTYGYNDAGDGWIRSHSKNKVCLFYESLGMFGILGLGDKETIIYTRKANCYETITQGQKLYKKVR